MDLLKLGTVTQDAALVLAVRPAAALRVAIVAADPAVVCAGADCPEVGA